MPELTPESTPESDLQDAPEAVTSTRALIKLGHHVTDTWVLSRSDECLPAVRPAIVSLSLWQQHSDQDDLAPWLPSDTELTPELAESLNRAAVVAVDFPAFTDGRGYTLARLLRERFGYAGEVRAIGDVLVDQLYYMQRCGFDALALREDQDVEVALKALSAFSVSYQPAIDLAEPLFARRLRERQVS